jgi:hypothetical protein
MNPKVGIKKDGSVQEEKKQLDMLTSVIVNYNSKARVHYSWLAQVSTPANNPHPIATKK